jgi:alpha-glucuronidase
LVRSDTTEVYRARYDYFHMPTPMAPLLSLLLMAQPADAAPADEAWLRYPAVTDAATKSLYADLPAVVVRAGDSPVLRSAEAELGRGVQALLGRTLRAAARAPARGGAIVLQARRDLPADGYRITVTGAGPATQVVIAGGNDRGALYGAFALLRRIALGQPLAGIDERRAPRVPLRMVDHWDNLDGTIERGYAGRSIFFEAGAVTGDLSRAAAYARLLASVGINGCAVNNVNADPRMLAPELLPELARIAAVFRPWGVRLYVSVDFASPQKLGGLPTFDPLDERVADWWRRAADAVYRAIPDFGGFVVKADSEGRLGPSAYGRTHADAANVIARALHPLGGVVFYRAFI